MEDFITFNSKMPLPRTNVRNSPVKRTSGDPSIENMEKIRHYHLDGQLYIFFNCFFSIAIHFLERIPLLDYLEFRPEAKEVIKNAAECGMLSLGPWLVQV